MARCAMTAPAAPSFIGGAARKRKLAIAGEKGLLGPGYNPARAAAPVSGGLRPSPSLKKAAQPPPRAAVGPTSGAKWIQVGEDSPLVLEQSLPQLAPAIIHAPEIQTLLSSAGNLLWDIAGETAGEIELTHDADWTLFPDVGEAMKAAGGEVQPLCIAVCASQGKWAIGAGGQWKKREQAARLALCIALAANIDDFGALAASQPEFTMFCESSGIATDTNLAHHAHAEPEFRAESPLAAKKQKVTSTAMESPKAVAMVDGAKLPRETPIWICVEEQLPDALESMTPEALAVCTDGVHRKGLYTAADRALAVLLEDPAAVEYMDDYNWETFGAVGSALMKIASEQECMCVAVCPAKELWAVGVGMKGKSRLASAKLAMATSLAIRAADEGEEVDLSECPSIIEFVEEARAARE